MEKNLERISAFLTPGENDGSPVRLIGNPFYSLGSKIYGQGFLFADGDPECTPLSVRTELVMKHPELNSRIRPYIGGEEILSHPQHLYNRYVILLSDIASELELDQWSALKDIVKDKVKPERDILGNNPNNIPLKRRWWAFQAHRPALYTRLAKMTRVLVASQVNPQFGFALLPADWIYSQKAVVICIGSYSAFCIIQCRVHESWARFFSSTLKDDLNYSPSDCFSNFPFPERYDSNVILERVGQAYYDYRAELMIQHDQGLTKTYNRFHARSENAPDIVRLRALHAEMDGAVLRAYGWDDLADLAVPEFVEQESDDGKAPKTRFDWPMEFKDQVLARLLALNAERAAAEKTEGLAILEEDDSELNGEELFD